MKIKMAVTACVFAFSMFTVAGQLTILYQLPFFLELVGDCFREVASMIVGGIIICGSVKSGFVKIKICLI